nr:MAG: non-structural polyprotein [Wenzhou bat orthohepevirus 1]
MDTSQWAAPKGGAGAIEAFALAAAGVAIEHAHVVHCFLSKEQTELLIKILSPVQLRFEPRVVWQHPVARVIHDYIEGVARRKCGPSYLEIGAHPRSINEHPAVKHRCFIQPAGRDLQRWHTAPRRGLANFIRRAVLRGSCDNENFCTLGFQNCFRPAEVGLALYSLHDLDPAAVVCAMAAHGMHTLYAALLLPPEALLPDGVYDGSHYRALCRDGNLVLTFAGDTCAGYRHSQATVAKWLKTTRVTGKHCAVFERVCAVDCHYLICITLSNPCPMPFTPFPSHPLVYITDIYPSVDALVGGGPPAVVAVPRTIWRRLMLFGNTLDDDAFCCSRLMTYLRGISHKVTVGGLVANEGWHPDAHTLTVTIAAAYLTIAHERWLRTQSISKGVKRLTIEHTQSFVRRAWEWLTKCVRSNVVDWYKQLSFWLSRGLVTDPATWIFDVALSCACCRRRPPSFRAPTPVVVRHSARPGCVRTIDGDCLTAGMIDFVYDSTTRRYFIRCGFVKCPVPCLTGFNRHLVDYNGRLVSFVFVSEYGSPLAQHFRCPSPTAPFSISADLDRIPVIPAATASAPFDEGEPVVAPADVKKPLSSPPPPLPPTLDSADPASTRHPPLLNHASLRPTTPDPVELPPLELQSSVPITFGAAVEPEVLHTCSDGSKIVCGDLFRSKCYWLVNAANPQFLPGGGVCGQFHRRFPDLFPVRGQRVRSALYQTGSVNVIHAVAPDYRDRVDHQRLVAAYQDACVRKQSAAFPVLGAGIYQVPFMESVRAWVDHHLPGDELYVHPSDRHRFVLDELLSPRSVLNVTVNMARLANLAIQAEKAPFNKFLEGAKVKTGAIGYQFIAGVPGAGKSTSVHNTGQLVVVPTRELAGPWRERGFETCTAHVACQRAKGRHIVVDEAPVHQPHLLLLIMQSAQSVLLLGDPKQIPALDFAHTGVTDALRLPLQPTEQLLVTHRCPVDVTRYLAADYPGISTTSKVRRSLYWGQPACGQILVFTQAAKAMHPGSMTVHEAQGSTFDQTTLIATLDARGLLCSSRSHAIVGLTRHRKKCHVIDCGGLLAEIGLTDSLMTMLLGQDLAPTPAPVVQPIREPISAVEATVPPTFTDVAATLSAEALGHQPQELAAVIPPAPELEQGVLYMPDRLDGRDDVFVVRLSDTVHCRLLAPRDRLSIVSTLVGRYGKLTLTPRADFDLRERSRWFLPSLEGCRPDEVEYLEYVTALHEKGQTGELILELSDDNAACFRITFFQKDCNKFTKDETLMHGKVGQGISAWPKTLCALFGPWFRAIEKYVVAQLPQGWFYGDLYNEADLHAHTMAVPDGVRVFENDFSEFDSTQNNTSLGLECALLREAGMPEWMVRLYWLERSYWILNAPDAALRGCWKKHSGEPGTLLFNTIWNMVVVNACYSFTDAVLHVYKGDDSVVICRDYAPTDDSVQLITSCGLKLKVNFSHIGLFSHYIVAPGEGVVKDLLRAWGRMTEKDFASPERMHDLCNAAKDFVSSVTSQGKEHLTIVLNSVYHRETEGFFQVIWGAIQSVANGDMSLTTYHLPIYRGE